MQQELAVILKLSGNADMARGFRQVADGAKSAAQNVDGLHAAERKLEQQQKALAATGGGGGPSPVQMQQRMAAAGGGIPGPFKAMLGLAAAGGAVQGLGQGFRGVSAMDSGASFGQALAGLTGKMLEGVPIVGNLVRGFGEVGDAITGLTAVIEANKRGLESALRSISGEGQINSIRLGGREAIISAGSGRRNALAAQLGQEAALGRLDSATLAGFRPTDIFGNEDVGLGSANRGVFDATTALDVARREAQARQAELAQTRSGFNPALDARIAEQRRVVGRAQAGVGSAERALNSTIFFDSSEKQALSGAQANASQQEAALAELLKTKQDEINAAKERQQALDQANVRIAQQELELAKANVEVQKQKVAKLDEQISRSKSGAVALGMGGPGESASLLATVQQLKDQGFSSLTPEQKSQLSANPLTAALVQQQAQAAGLADPNNAAIRGLVGQIAPNLALPDLSALEAERANVVDAIARQMIENERKFQESVGNALGSGLGKFTDAIETVVAAKIEEMRLRILSDINKGNVQGRS